MIKKLLEQSAKFLSTFLHNTLVLVVTSIIGVPTLLSWATGTLDILTQTVKSPMPIWGTISLALLCCGYTYIKVAEIQDKSRKIDQSLDDLINIKIAEIKAKFASTSLTPSQQSEARKPNIMISLIGSNIFSPGSPDVQDLWTGIGINAKAWNTGEPSIATEWLLFVIPEDEVPVIAQLTEIPESLRVSGPFNSVVIRASESLQVKTKITPIGITPVEGTLLFYVAMKREIVMKPSTRLELIVKDIHGEETKATKRLGDWLGR